MVEEQSAGSGMDMAAYKARVSQDILSQTRFIKDFPKKGINFMDIFSITTNPPLFKKLIESIKIVIENEIGRPGEAFDVIYGLESRGFIIGPIIAQEWNLPFSPIRKKGKLPGDVISYSYDLEYGSDTIEVQKGIYPTGVRVIMIDDLLATGGTLHAAEQLMAQIPGHKLVASVVAFEIEAMKGRNKVKYPVSSVITLK